MSYTRAYAVSKGFVHLSWAPTGGDVLVITCTGDIPADRSVSLDDLIFDGDRRLTGWVQDAFMARLAVALWQAHSNRRFSQMNSAELRIARDRLDDLRAEADRQLAIAQLAVDRALNRIGGTVANEAQGTKVTDYE